MRHRHLLGFVTVYVETRRLNLFWLLRALCRPGPRDEKGQDGISCPLSEKNSESILAFFRDPAACGSDCE